MNYILLIVASFVLLTHHPISAQDNEGTYLKDTKTGCKVWYKIGFEEDSVHWTGGCKNGLADGRGTFTGYTHGKQSSKYTGDMKAGKPDGTGSFSFWGGTGKLKGHFTKGEFLNLSSRCMDHLQKDIVSETDSLQTYVGDDNARQLYVHAIAPAPPIRGAIVLMPGNWETTEHLLSSNKKLCDLAYENHLAVLALSINQRLTMTTDVLALMNTMLANAQQRYNIPKDKFVIGGWSMGGLFSLRYSEFACQDSAKTTLKPVAAFCCDGPCDLENLYLNAKKKLQKFPVNGESQYIIRELEKYCGGPPETYRQQYSIYSCYTHARPDGGNANYLKNIPVRIYNDVDPNWWMENRHVDMYEMNALDQSAMILGLQEMGNTRAEFINAFGKGYRIEGNRHPHSWSIVEPEDCIKWILKCLGEN